jgi:hypothetical protein
MIPCSFSGMVAGGAADQGRRGGEGAARFRGGVSSIDAAQDLV